MFKTIGVAKNGVVWAGTANQGLYQYRDAQWQKWNQSPYTSVNFQDMDADQNGGMWIAQSGINGAQSTYGGILYFPGETFADFEIFTPTADGLPTRNVRSIFVDTTRYTNIAKKLPTIWSAHYATISPAASGGVGRGLYDKTVMPAFDNVNYYIDSTNDTGGVFYIGGDTKEIWSYASNNYGKSMIIRYDAQTSGLLQPYTASLVSEQFVARGIYFDANGNRWITINGEGLLVQDKGNNWHKINFPELFTSQPFFNPNAITGDAAGNVYIGTLNGLVVFHAGYPLDELESYKRYTTSSGLLSTNVLSIAVDTSRNKLLLGTDAGICFWAPACTGENLKKVYYTSASGDLTNGSTWCFGEAPKPNSEILVKHPLTISSNTTVGKVTITPTGSISVTNGAKLDITNRQ